MKLRMKNLGEWELPSLEEQAELIADEADRMERLKAQGSS